VEFPGAVYHVMARGNERRAVFRDDPDRQRFWETLAEAVERFGLRLYAYCLMPNHYHLVLATPRANLSRAMGWLQTTYTARFNRRHRRNGHLFQGRYKAQLVEADAYAQWLVEYVHLNPVRPRRKSDPIPGERAAQLTGYRWSSHRDYAGLNRTPAAWLCLDWLAYWGRTRREAQAGYRQRLRQAFGKPVNNPWEQMRHGLVLGSEPLRAKAQALLARKPGQEERHWTKAVESKQWQQRVRQQAAAHADPRIQIWTRVRLGGERGVDVARDYGYASGNGIGQVVKRLEQRAVEDRRLKQLLTRTAAALQRESV